MAENSEWEWTGKAVVMAYFKVGALGIFLDGLRKTKKIPQSR
jgi:hypothetical protein